MRRIISRIKDNQEDYINKQVESRLGQVLAEKNISISFEHELANDNYTPDGIRDKNERLHFYEEFRKKVKNLSCISSKCVFG